MTTPSPIARRLAGGLVLLWAGAIALASTPAAVAAGPLVGTFQLTPGHDSAGGVGGSYFRMIQAGGSASSGPFFTNADSSAGDKTYTFLSPGTDSGLVTGSYQPEPSPAFDADGNSLANRIMDPTKFFGVKFGVDTAPIDPQTAIAVVAPSISDDGAGNLSGDLRAWAASWNDNEFNQGSPKPDGTKPGLTAGPTGTYDSNSGAYTLDWTSLIVGGPFNGFTGKWHLAGTFFPPGSPGGPGDSGGPGTTVEPKLVKRHVSATARFSRKAKRFVVDTGYSLSCPTGGPASTVKVKVTSLHGSAGSSRKRTYVVARRTLGVAAGVTTKVKFTLNHRGAKFLHKRKRLHVRFTITAHPASGKAISAAGARRLKLR